MPTGLKAGNKRVKQAECKDIRELQGLWQIDNQRYSVGSTQATAATQKAFCFARSSNS